MRKISLSLALLSSSLFAQLDITNDISNIYFDGSSESGTLQAMYIYKENKYIKSFKTKTGTISLVPGNYKGIMVLSENGKTRYVSSSKLVSDGTAPNVRPNIVMNISISGNTVSFDLSSSTDSDGRIVKYQSFLYKDEKYIGKSYNTPTFSESLTVAGNYKVISTVTDDDGAVSYASKTFTITEVKEGPNYTLGTPTNVDIKSAYTRDVDGNLSYNTTSLDLASNNYADRIRYTVGYRISF